MDASSGKKELVTAAGVRVESSICREEEARICWVKDGLELDRGKRTSSGGKGAEREGVLSSADGFIGGPL